jgi:hypothetical protein
MAFNEVINRVAVILLYMILNVSCFAENHEYLPLFKCTERLDNPYGICSHINTVGKGSEFDTREQELAMINRLGIQWIRTGFNWRSFIESNSDTLSFSHYDKVMEPVISNRKSMLGILMNLDNPNKIDKWEDYVSQVVQHYGETINFWEMINEADYVHLRVPTYRSVDYARLYKVGYEVVKKVNPKATVLFSGLADANSLFLDSIIQQGSDEFFDIMNIHHYANKKVEPESFITYYTQLKSKFEKLKIDKHVWMTETGCTTANNWATEETQMLRLPRIFLISFALGIEKVFWYKSRSNELNVDDKECFFGLWHNDYSPKPAFYAYQTLVKLCPDKSMRPTLLRRGNIYISKWIRPDGKVVYGLWTSKGNEMTILNVNGKYTCYDIYGNEKRIQRKEFEITPSIHYIVGEKKLKLSIDENLQNLN